MAAETQYTANTSGVGISTANGERDGTGAMGSVITAAASGTIIRNIYIKATGNTTRGMIRLFVYDGTNTRLLKEVNVFPVTQSGTNPSFEAKLRLNFFLNSGFILKASTQNAESFLVIAEGMDTSYYAGAVREDTTQFTANNGTARISTANSNLNGSGTVATIYTAGSPPTYNGSRIETITVKSIQTNTPGMVRLYINNKTTNGLITEIPIPSSTPDSMDQSFETTLLFKDGLNLSAGYSITASTQNAESFNVIIEGRNWNYAS